MKVIKQYSPEITLQIALGMLGGGYVACPRKEATAKVTLYGWPNDDNKRRQRTFYFREVKVGDTF